MTSKGTDRRGRGKEPKNLTAAASETTEAALAAFTLPDSLPCSEVEFPVINKQRAKANWKDIVEESDKWQQQLEEYRETKAPALKRPFLKTECDYIQNEVFVQLIPALIGALNKAKIWNALVRPQCFFNGIDYIVQELWNNNPRHPSRREVNLHLFNMPWVKKSLIEHPRPYYPKSWLWPEEYAAILIQKTVRQYFVQKQEDVGEMRDFWKKLELESRIPDMDTNPFLARKFASAMAVDKQQQQQQQHQQPHQQLQQQPKKKK